MADLEHSPIARRVRAPALATLAALVFAAGACEAPRAAAPASSPGQEAPAAAPLGQIEASDDAPAAAPTEPPEAPPASLAQPEAPPPAPPAPQPPTPVTPGATRRAHADLDPTNDGEIGPPPALPDCERQLEAAGVRFRPARIGVGRKRDGVYTCGAFQVVRFTRGPGKVRYSSSPLLTCQMALALADFERILQEEAESILGSRVVSIEHLGTYNCRDMANYELISEHSFANAIDLRRLTLASGKTIDVLEHFRPEEVEVDDPRARFLRRLGQRLYDEDVFSNVLTPYFDRIHRNHFHLDLARYRVDGSRP